MHEGGRLILISGTSHLHRADRGLNVGMESQSDARQVRFIEAQTAPTRFARGWHCLGLIRDFDDGNPHAVNAFGQKLVVFRGGDGTINVLDSYCRHMGGDLSNGEVKGDAIACPFHDWRWGGDGRCKQVPYAKRTPRLARTVTWTTLEQDGMLFVWNDPEHNQPVPEVTIPRIEGATSDDWTDWHWYTTVVNTNCREIIDNVVDMAHFYYIHGSLPTHFKNIFEGHVATQYMNSAGRPDLGGTEGARMLGTTSVASYWGPSFMIDDLTYHYEHADHHTVLINCHYPIDANSFVLQYGIIVKKSADLPDDLAMETAIALGDFVKLGFEQDVAIWRNKARIDNPLLVEEDGPVYQLRRWYQQFYVDVADVQPDMVDRFEFELDTTRPYAAWLKEVEANIAAGAGSVP
ncbi:3-ketosteroid-9-alpha-monooxygenase, oxygenase component [Mycobacterium simulans]|nr:3-ketosteroid-9-alpha-monooxygenase, oxygenase component [Mycobacterium simulans]